MTLVDFFAAITQLLGLLLVITGMAAMRMRMGKPLTVQPLRLVQPVAREALVSRRRRR